MTGFEMRDGKYMTETQQQPGPIKLPGTQQLDHTTNRMVRRSLSRLTDWLAQLAVTKSASQLDQIELPVNTSM